MNKNKTDLIYSKSTALVTLITSEKAAKLKSFFSTLKTDFSASIDEDIVTRINFITTNLDSFNSRTNSFTKNNYLTQIIKGLESLIKFLETHLLSRLSKRQTKPASLDDFAINDVDSPIAEDIFGYYDQFRASTNDGEKDDLATQIYETFGKLKLVRSIRTVINILRIKIDISKTHSKTALINKVGAYFNELGHRPANFKRPATRRRDSINMLVDSDSGDSIDEIVHSTEGITVTTGSSSSSTLIPSNTVSTVGATSISTSSEDLIPGSTDTSINDQSFFDDSFKPEPDVTMQWDGFENENYECSIADAPGSKQAVIQIDIDEIDKSFYVIRDQFNILDNGQREIRQFIRIMLDNTCQFINKKCHKEAPDTVQYVHTLDPNLSLQERNIVNMLNLELQICQINLNEISQIEDHISKLFKLTKEQEIALRALLGRILANHLIDNDEIELPVNSFASNYLEKGLIDSKIDHLKNAISDKHNSLSNLFDNLKLSVTQLEGENANRNDVNSIKTLIAQSIQSGDVIENLSDKVKHKLSLFIEDKLDSFRREKRNGNDPLIQTNELKLSDDRHFKQVSDSLNGLQQSYIHNWLSQLLDKIEFLIAMEEKIKKGYLNAEIIVYLQESLGIKSLKTIRKKKVEGNEYSFEIFSNPKTMYKLDPLPLIADGIHFELVSHNYGYGRKNSDINEYCVKAIKYNEFLYCDEFVQKPHECYSAFLSDQNDKCIFKAYKAAEDDDISKSIHSLEQDNSLFTIFLKKDEIRKNIKATDVDIIEKYRLPLDTIRSEIAHLNIESKYSFHSIVRQMTENFYFSMISLVLATLNISLITIYVCSKLCKVIKKCMDAYIERQQNLLAEQVPLNNRPQRRVHFSGEN